VTTLAPIAVFLYRRPDHARAALESLLRCPEAAASQFYVYCDAAKTPDLVSAVAATRRVAHELAPDAVFVERERNHGLARSIIDGVSSLVEEHGRVIVVEDDLEVAPGFLSFMNRALERYRDDDVVMSVSGYQFPLDPPLDIDSTILALPTSWGWATWARAWRHFDAAATGYASLRRDRALRRRFDLDGAYPYHAMLARQQRGQVDSWAIRWYLSIFMRGGLNVFPGRTLVKNTGFDGSGTHGAVGFAMQDVAGARRVLALSPPVLDLGAQRRVTEYLAEQTARDKTRRVKHLVARVTNAALSHRVVPRRVRSLGASLLARAGIASSSGKQDLDVYWDPEMAAVLETWGIGNAWNEIQLLLANVRGTVIDIACGTGKVMSILADYSRLEVHGFDISDFLIQKAIDRGIPRERLRIADATKTGYPDDAFDYGYSIGSLEHFTESGIVEFVAETKRYTRYASFHQIPTSRSGRDEGWIKTLQSYHNNSVNWWLARFRTSYDTVRVLDSAWQDKISLGKWFVCVNQI
jgi:ubiquinone/menaquinone biosynthesis C-methylase UbiE